MANLERIYIIPLGHLYSEPGVKRGKKAMRDIRKFTARHMKADASNVRIGTALNRRILRDGIGTPPRRVKVRIVKDDAGIARVDLFGSKPDEKEEPKAKPVEKPKDEKKTDVAKETKEEQKKPLSDAEKKAEKEARKAEMKK